MLSLSLNDASVLYSVCYNDTAQGMNCRYQQHQFLASYQWQYFSLSLSFQIKLLIFLLFVERSAVFRDVRAY